MDHPGAPGEVHGKEETMDEVFIDDSQGHGDDQLVMNMYAELPVLQEIRIQCNHPVVIIFIILHTTIRYTLMGKGKKIRIFLQIVLKHVYVNTKRGSGVENSNLGHFPMRKWPRK